MCLVLAGGVCRYDIFSVFMNNIKSLIHPPSLVDWKDMSIQFYLKKSGMDTNIVAATKTGALPVRLHGCWFLWTLGVDGILVRVYVP